jgi:hypothetical protein
MVSKFVLFCFVLFQLLGFEFDLNLRIIFPLEIHLCLIVQEINKFEFIFSNQSSHQKLNLFTLNINILQSGNFQNFN